MRTATQLVRGDGLLPACRETAEQVESLLQTNIPPETATQIHAALGEAWEASRGITARTCVQVRVGGVARISDGVLYLLRQ